MQGLEEEAGEGDVNEEVRRIRIGNRGTERNFPMTRTKFLGETKGRGGRGKNKR